MDLPDRWAECSNGAYEQAVCTADQLSEVGVMIIDNVVADPCNDVGLDPPVGSTVEDLADAIAGLPGFEATSAIDVEVGVRPGKELTVTAPTITGCPLFTWMGPERTNGVGPAEVNRIRIVDVDGVRVLIAAAYHPTAEAPGIPADVEQVFESVRFP